jgi:hypothetical protein
MFHIRWFHQNFIRWSSQVQLLITDNAFCTVQKATAQSKTVIRWRVSQVTGEVFIGAAQRAIAVHQVHGSRSLSLLLFLQTEAFRRGEGACLISISLDRGHHFEIQTCDLGGNRFSVYLKAVSDLIALDLA